MVSILSRFRFIKRKSQQQPKNNSKNCVIPGVGGVLPREGSAPGAPAPPKLPLDEPFVAYSLEDLAAEAFGMRIFGLFWFFVPFFLVRIDTTNWVKHPNTSP